MQKALVLGLVGVSLAAAAAGVLRAMDAGRRAADAEAKAEEAGRAARDAGAQALEVRKKADEAVAASRAALEEGYALRARVEALEARGSPAPARAPGAAPPAGPENPPAVAGARDPAARKAAMAEFRSLLKKVFGDRAATTEEQKRFWEMARKEGFADDLVAELEGVVAEKPGDAEARLELGQAYVAKIFTVPAGPEMGVWGAKAEGQWQEILKQDDRHWQARFNLAFSWSQYPDFLNKAPDSIREFETVRRFQEEGTAEPRQAQVYLQLSILYRKLGNAEKAREALEAGRRRHPEDTGIARALEALGK